MSVVVWEIGYYNRFARQKCRFNRMGGYKDAAYDISDFKEISYVNECVFRMGKQDIILVGTQSNTIPYRFGNLNFLTIHQQNILSAIEPDAVLLCINADDEIEYVKRTITVVENLYLTKVIAIIVYPFHKEILWNTNLAKGERLCEEEIVHIKKRIERELGKKTYINGKQEDMESLYENMIEYFVG